MPNVSFRLLFQVLSSEQSILARTDQKAYTLFSVLGVFMVFFIVYYRLMAINLFIPVMLGVYFPAALLTILSLLRTLLPRFQRAVSISDEHAPEPDPTFFGGIREFSSSEAYYIYIKDLEADDDLALKQLSRQVYALAGINLIKNTQLRWAMVAFTVAITTNLVMILSTFVSVGLDFLSGSDLP